MVTVHRLFPLGMECAHCERWYGLRDAIEHAKQFHSDCNFCYAERSLAQSLLNDALEMSIRRQARIDVPIS